MLIVFILKLQLALTFKI